MTDLSAGLVRVIGVGALSSALEIGADRAPRAAGDLSKLLGKAGCEVVELGAIDTPDAAVAAGRKLAENHCHAVALAVASWFEDYLALDLLEECGIPVLLWSLPGMETGALCGVQQLTACLTQLGAPFACVYGDLTEGVGLPKAGSFLRAASLKHRLRRARVGLAGHHVGGMTEVSVNEIALKKAIGPRIVPLDLPRLLEGADRIDGALAKAEWDMLAARATRCDVSEQAGLDSMRVYVAIKELVASHGLDALTIGCYPHLMGRVCLAASLLADQDVPLACEGDANGAVGQLMLTLLSGRPTHNTDWLEPRDDGTVMFTHCGSGSLSLAERPDQVSLGPVRLMDRGACALFPSRPGPVTLVNLIPREQRYQMAVLTGQAVTTEMVFPGNPLRVRFRPNIVDLIDWIHEEGIGHHWMAGYGHLSAELRAWSRLTDDSVRYIEA